ncbi:MAG: hypothetical protein DCC73_11575 [Proteobacteria bacterium]|nr:MAG: hypothetical protein DCC73_11575 [Pseudomonadota bacterium]
MIHIIEKLTTANAGTNDLDADVMEHLGCAVKRTGYWQYKGDPYGAGAQRWYRIPELTSSIDGAIQFIRDRQVNEPTIILHMEPSATTAWITIPPARRARMARASTAPLALLAAFLSEPLP